MAEKIEAGMGIVVEPRGRAAGTMCDNMNISPVKKKLTGFITCSDPTGISVVVMRGQAEGGAIEGFLPRGQEFKQFFKISGGKNVKFAKDQKHFGKVFPDAFVKKK